GPIRRGSGHGTSERWFGLIRWICRWVWDGASSHHDPSLAAFITNIVESDFRYTQDRIISTSGYDFRKGQRWWCWHRRNTTQLLTGRARMAGQVNKQEDRHVEGS